MTILFADDFMGYGTDASLLLNGLWGSVGANIAGSPDPNDPAGTKCMVFAGVGNQARRPFSVGSIATAGTALRLWMPALPAFTTACIRYLDGSNNLQANMAITPTGVIEVYLGSPGHGGTLLGSSGTPALTANAFHHIEFKILCNLSSAGTFEVRVDGVTVASGTGLTTGTAYQLGLGTTNDYNGEWGRTDYIKDLVQWSGAGSHNNDFLGTVSVLGMTTNSDVTLGGWTTSSGTTGWNLLDDSPPNDGVDYLSAAYPPPAAMTFGLTNLPINVTSVRALITQVRARKVDGGDGNLQSSLISSGDTISGSDRPLTTAFTYYEDVFETDPHTSANWSPASADAVQFKINRTV